MSAARPGKRVAFVGLGYVGLATAVCFASKGFDTLGIDVDKTKLKSIQAGTSPIHEEGLEELLQASIEKKRFHVRSDYDELEGCNSVFITVGTPSRKDGSIDSRYVEAASQEIGRHLGGTRGYRLVVVKSTVTPGTTEGLVRRTIEKESGMKAGRGFGLASNPEFLHEGSAISETLHPDAVVIGGHDLRSTTALRDLYATFYHRLPPTILTSPPNAEMMKYAINAGRATQVSFVNTIANFCSKVPGCDYDEVRKGLSMVAKMDPRYLSAGLGFGGSCLPKDARALAAALESAGVTNEVVTAAIKVNEGQVEETIKLAEGLCGTLAGKKVSVLGLAFKAGTDDVRESVSVSLVLALVRRKARISVFDPKAMENARPLLGKGVDFARTPQECLAGSECAFIATGWDSFKELKPEDFRVQMASPVVIDGRRVYDQASFRSAEIIIATLGTGPKQY